MYFRKLSLLGLVLCALVLGAAYSIEYFYLLSPCPLCSLQRFIFYMLGLVFAIGALFQVKSLGIYLISSVVLFFSATGQALAARQIWLQYFAPPQTSSCSADLQRLMELYPLAEVLKLALGGSSECAKIDFTIFGLSIAAWSFVLFTVISMTAIYIIWTQKKGGAFSPPS